MVTLGASLIVTPAPGQTTGSTGGANPGSPQTPNGQRRPAAPGASTGVGPSPIEGAGQTGNGQVLSGRTRAADGATPSNGPRAVEPGLTR